MAIHSSWSIAQFLAVHASIHYFAKPAGFEFSREKVLKLAEQQVG